MIIETARLVLRPFTDADTRRLHAIQADPRVYPTIGGPPPPLDEFVPYWTERMRAHREAHGYALLAVTRKADGEMIGRAGLIRQEVDGTTEVEVAYVLAPSAWGCGYATEAARASRDWGFANLPVHHLVSLILPTNTASLRVAAANGMRVWKEAEFRGFHVQVHRIDRPEWERIRRAAGGTE